MIINLTEWMNSILKGTHFLPIFAIVKSTFKRTKSWFVEWGM